MSTTKAQPQHGQHPHGQRPVRMAARARPAVAAAPSPAPSAAMPWTRTTSSRCRSPWSRSRRTSGSTPARPGCSPRSRWWSPAVGGALAGVLADRIGRVRALMITVGTYALFTVLCGFAPNYETLLVFRALQGLGFGGEWAVGAILVAEYASARASAGGPWAPCRARGRSAGRSPSSCTRWCSSWSRRHRLARGVLDRRAARAAARLRTAQRQGRARRRRAAARHGPHDERRRHLRRDLPGAAAAHDPLRRAAVHRCPGRLLHARHLGADLPEERAAPHGRRHRRLSGVPDLRRLPRLSDRRPPHRPCSAARRTSRCSRSSRRSASCSTRTCRPARTPSSWCSASRSASACRPSSAASARSSASCTRPPCAAPARASRTTPGGPWAPSSPRWSAISPTAGASGGALVFGAVGYAIAVLALLGLPETRGQELV